MYALLISRNCLFAAIKPRNLFTIDYMYIFESKSAIEYTKQIYSVRYPLDLFPYFRK